PADEYACAGCSGERSGKSSRRAVVSVASRTAWYTQRLRRLPTALTTRNDTCTGYRACRNGRFWCGELARAPLGGRPAPPRLPPLMDNAPLSTRLTRRVAHRAVSANARSNAPRIGNFIPVFGDRRNAIRSPGIDIEHPSADGQFAFPKTRNQNKSGWGLRARV